VQRSQQYPEGGSNKDKNCSASGIKQYEKKKLSLPNVRNDQLVKEFLVEPSKDETQTALFKDPVRTAL
jgi:hypothetical protein